MKKYSFWLTWLALVVVFAVALTFSFYKTQQETSAQTTPGNVFYIRTFYAKNSTEWQDYYAKKYPVAKNLIDKGYLKFTTSLNETVPKLVITQQTRDGAGNITNEKYVQTITGINIQPGNNIKPDGIENEIKRICLFEANKLATPIQLPKAKDAAGLLVLHNQNWFQTQILLPFEAGRRKDGSLLVNAITPPSDLLEMAFRNAPIRFPPRGLLGLILNVDLPIDVTFIGFYSSTKATSPQTIVIRVIPGPFGTITETETIPGQPGGTTILPDLYNEYFPGGRFLFNINVAQLNSKNQACVRLRPNVNNFFLHKEPYSKNVPLSVVQAVIPPDKNGKLPTITRIPQFDSKEIGKQFNKSNFPKVFGLHYSGRAYNYTFSEIPYNWEYTEITNKSTGRKFAGVLIIPEKGQQLPDVGSPLFVRANGKIYLVGVYSGDI